MRTCRSSEPPPAGRMPDMARKGQGRLPGTARWPPCAGLWRGGGWNFGKPPGLPGWMRRRWKTWLRALRCSGSMEKGQGAAGNKAPLFPLGRAAGIAGQSIRGNNPGIQAIPDAEGSFMPFPGFRLRPRFFNGGPGFSIHSQWWFLQKLFMHGLR